MDLEALIVAAVGGDPDAANQLLIESEGRIRAIVLKRSPAWLRQHKPVEDTMQDAFVAHFRGIGTFELRDPIVPHFIAWSTLLTKRAVLKALRRTGVSLQHLESDIYETDGKSPSSLQRRSERYERLSNCIASLSGQDQEVVVLHYFRKMSLTEIADELRLTREAVNSRLMRVRPRLRECLGSTSMNLSTS